MYVILLLLLHSYYIAHYLILKLLKVLYIKTKKNKKTQITKSKKQYTEKNYSQINYVKHYIEIWQKEKL